jgi:dihydroorotate dehydrogenase electron transfer subunit
MNPTHSRRDSTDSGARQFTAQVLENRPLSSVAYRLDLSLPFLKALEASPGQFFMVRTTPGFDPLLRRPFSILSIDRPDDGIHRRLSLLFRTVGRGTQLMAQWTSGCSVDMLGPLGRGYTLPKDRQNVVMIAGGIGIASLFGLAEWILLARGMPSHLRICIGGKSREDILLKPDLENMGIEVDVTTEDGTMGTTGVVTDWFQKALPSLWKKGKPMIYACGPMEMMTRVASIAQDFSLRCEVSLEARMACGLGSCLGCVFKTPEQGYRLVCKDGPTLDAREIDWKATGRLL